MKKGEVIFLYCPQCGTKVNEAEEFCPECGNKLGSASGVGPRKNSNKTMAIVAIVCCVICAAVAITAIVTNNVKEPATAETTPQTKDPSESTVASEPQNSVTNLVQTNETETPKTDTWADAYLWPSDKFYMSEADLQGYTQEGVAALRNEIYARRGYIFKTDKWRDYFAQFSWYLPNPDFNDSLFNEVERANIATIVAYEKARGWRGEAAPSTYSYSGINGYFWPTNTCYITDSDLAAYSQNEVATIRNEIYARHGYEFQTEKWRNYFAQFSWYQPNPNFSESQFSDIERDNLDTIVNYEKSQGW